MTNEEIRKRMGSKRNIILRIKERKLNLFGHICRMEDSRLVKEVFGEMEGITKRGRPKRRLAGQYNGMVQRESIAYILKNTAQDRDAWKLQVKVALGTNIHETLDKWMDGWMDET